MTEFPGRVSPGRCRAAVGCGANRCSVFGFVSDFGLRISDFGLRTSTSPVLSPSFKVESAGCPRMLHAMNNQAQHFIKEDPWRIFRIMAEFVDSFETMCRVGPAVTVFGSARMKPSNPCYRAAVALGRGLAK